MMEWARKCAGAHSVATPAVVASIKAKQAEQQHYGKMAAKAGQMERCAYLSSSSAMPTLRAFKAGGSAPSSISAQKQHAEMFSPVLRLTANKLGKTSKAPASKREEQERDEADAEAESALDEMEATLSAAMPDFVSFGSAVTPVEPAAPLPPSSRAVAPAVFGFGLGGGVAAPHFSAAGAAVHSEIRDLLSQFKTEPAEEELAVKFALFEDFQRTVEVVRDSVMDFWTENAGHFPAEIRAHTEREIAGIDNADHLGVNPHGSTWIVYYMCIKAHENSTMITGLLSSIKARIGLLAQEPGDCPCCLLPMTAAETHTLGCCHKTCEECWVQWKALKGSEVFCPVCRSEEFVDEVVRVVV